MDAPELIHCNICKEHTPFTERGAWHLGPWGKKRSCKPCLKYANGAYKYGITTELYQERMQSVVSCELCGDSRNTMCYDHDHTTGEFRGILCRMCNSSLGHFGDNVEGLQKAIKYLNRSNKL